MKKHNNIVIPYVAGTSEELWRILNKIKQPLHNQMAQHKRANSSGQDLAVHIHLKGKKSFF